MDLRSAWPLITFGMILGGLLASRRRRVAIGLVLSMLSLIVVVSAAIYFTEASAQSAPDFEPHDGPFTPAGWVILINIIYFVPWVLAFVGGWAAGAFARRRRAPEARAGAAFADRP